MQLILKYNSVRTSVYFIRLLYARKWPYFIIVARKLELCYIVNIFILGISLINNEVVKEF